MDGKSEYKKDSGYVRVRFLQPADRVADRVMMMIDGKQCEVSPKGHLISRLSLRASHSHWSAAGHKGSDAFFVVVSQSNTDMTLSKVGRDVHCVGKVGELESYSILQFTLVHAPTHAETCS